MTLRHYWSRDLDSAPRAAVLPVCVSSFLAPFTVDKVWVCSISVCIALQQEELLPWKIAECPLPTFTFKQFYEDKVGSEFSDRVLKQVFVGQTKESLDLVDYDLL